MITTVTSILLHTYTFTVFRSTLILDSLKITGDDINTISITSA